MKLSNQKGFSLIELMVVVAIIGLLAAVGVPQYAKFQAKARTSEAKTALAGLYQAEKSFQLEWNNYTVDLRNAGFGVEGAGLRYVTGFQTAQACSVYPGAPAPAEVLTQTQSISTGVNQTGAWHATVGTAGTDIAAAILTTAAGDCTQNSFTAKALGDPRNTPAALALTSDTWTVNQNKVIANTIVNY